MTGWSDDETASNGSDSKKRNKPWQAGETAQRSDGWSDDSSAGNKSAAVTQSKPKASSGGWSDDDGGSAPPARGGGFSRGSSGGGGGWGDNDGGDSRPARGGSRGRSSRGSFGGRGDNDDGGFKQNSSFGDDNGAGFGGGDGNRPERSMENLGANLNPLDFDTVKLSELNTIVYTEHENTKTRSKEEIQAFLTKEGITVKGEDVPKPIMSFDELNMPDVLNLFHKEGYESPTAIQSLGWPIALSNRDLVGIARTGSGKTLSFVIPALVHIKQQRPLASGEGPIAVVVCPTRELAIQVDEVTQKFCTLFGVRSAVVYGGVPRYSQKSALYNGVEMVVATPGRLIDFLESNATNLLRTSYFVLDEADRMFDMGFGPQVRKIASVLRPDRQTLLWSATWPREVRSLATEYLRNSVHIQVGSQNISANPNITQNIEIIEPRKKDQRLGALLDMIYKKPEKKTLVFVGTKKKADEVANVLRCLGITALALHGDKEQGQREKILADFRSNRSWIILATDVCSRGLDVDDISYVVNYDFPNSVTDYVHRIGRTARHSKTGTSYTFITEFDAQKVKDLPELLQQANQPVPPELVELIERRCGGGGYSNFGNRGSRSFNGGGSNGVADSSSVFASTPADAGQSIDDDW